MDTQSTICWLEPYDFYDCFSIIVVKTSKKKKELSSQKSVETACFHELCMVKHPQVTVNIPVIE